MEQNRLKQKLQQGFTVVELMIVFTIMITVFVVVLVQFGQQRIARSTILGQNEMVTHIKKVQNYVLSSRNISTANPAAFYMLYFQKNTSSYQIRGVTKTNQYFGNIETIQLADGVMVSNIIVTNRRGMQSTPDCIQVIYAAPFGTMYVDSTGVCDSSITTTLQDPAALSSKADHTVQLVLSNPKGGQQKTVTLYSLTGKVIAN
jgi:competence protein ComGC